MYDICKDIFEHPIGNLDYLKEINKNKPNFISLSGGVDSIVCLFMIKIIVN